MGRSCDVERKRRIRTNEHNGRYDAVCWSGWRMNELKNFRDVFRGITPYSGTPPKGFLVDFLGTLTDSRFRIDFNGSPETDGGSAVTTRLPVIEDGEGWFEGV